MLLGFPHTTMFVDNTTLQSRPAGRCCPLSHSSFFQVVVNLFLKLNQDIPLDFEYILLFSPLCYQTHQQ